MFHHINVTSTLNRDSYSTTIKILDENDNVLAITTSIQEIMTLIIRKTLTHIQIL